MRDRIFRKDKEPITWTTAIVLGTLIYLFSILVLGQLPSVIIYRVDQYVAEIIELSKSLPGVGDNGLTTLWIRTIRDIIANTIQIGILLGMLIVAYLYQERKRKRTGSKGLEDPVKGYMSGK